jgi:putative flippase GtrA
MQLLIAQAVRYGLVGFVGLFVNITVMNDTRSLVSLQLAGALAYVAAASVTWALHRTFTFRGHAPRRVRRVDIGRQWLVFVAVNVVGGAVYYGIFWSLTTHVAPCRANPVIAICAGGTVGLIVNFLMSRSFVFRQSVEPLLIEQAT